LLLKKLEPTEIVVCYNEENVVFVFMAGKRLLHVFRIPQQLALEKIRKNRCDDVQAITAVHESGHALLSMVLLKTIPDAIFSVTADSNAGGFVHTKIKWDYLPKHQITRHVAMMLGGYVAENLVFGNENATAGSEADIQQATEFVMRIVKSSGLGNTHYFIQTPSPETNYAVYDMDGSVNDEAKKLLDESKSLAEETLQKQISLLLHLADYLADHQSMKPEVAREMLQTYSVSFDPKTIIENGDLLFYRASLKDSVKRIEASIGAKKRVPQRYSIITMNKKKSNRK